MKNFKNIGLEFIVLVGPPGVGKTTWRNENATEDHVVLSTDDIMKSMCKTPEDYNKCWGDADWKKIRSKFNIMMRESVNNKKSIIVDTTNMRSKRRRKLLATIGKNYNKIAIVFDWDYKKLLERNENRTTSREIKKMKVETIDDFIDNFQAVNKTEEGFDKVINIPFRNKRI